jgi:NTP pyrophosphatase (non-canonical NTP hydrolase)
MEYTKENIWKLAEDLERCADPQQSCVGCMFDKICDRGDENGGAIFRAAAAVIRWQTVLLEETNTVRPLGCARDDSKTMTSADRSDDAGKGQEWQVGLYDRTIKRYGQIKQVTKAVEELGELAVELSRWLLNDEAHDEHLLSHIKEELADVCIMTDQLQLIFGDVSDWEMHKLERLERKLERGL